MYDASGESEDVLRTGIRDVFSRGEARALRIINATPGVDLLSFWSGIGQTLGSTMPIGSDGAVGVATSRTNTRATRRFAELCAGLVPSALQLQSRSSRRSVSRISMKPISTLIASDYSSNAR